MKLFKRNKIKYDKIGAGEAEEKPRISKPYNVSKGIVFKSRDENKDDAPRSPSGSGAKWRQWVTKLRNLNTVKY